MRSFGKYRLVEPLASGGMADVWRAEVAGAEGVVKEVALKLIRGEHAARSDFVRMFVQEARLAARLNHANLVQVYEFDQIDGRYYLAMELVRGRHLGQVVERAREAGARFGLARAVHVVAEVARGLAYAHRLADGGRPMGLVHRDVSPHNVLVSFEGEVKLADFGIARVMDQAELTAPGTLKGKVAYMAPEQASVSAVDARADVFSLGVVLWELCAGRRLFARESDAATLAAVLAPEPVSPPSAWNEEVPAELDAAILGALERDPERRTGSAQELAAALAAVLLRVTRAPEDVDVRAFVQRLFPREAALAATGAAAQEATAVRSVPVAREPQAEWTPAEAAPVAREETATRTAPPRRPRRGGAARLALGAAAAAALAVAATRGRNAGEGAVTPASTAIPSPSPTAIPSPSPSPSPSARQVSELGVREARDREQAPPLPDPLPRSASLRGGEGDRSTPSSSPSPSPSARESTAGKAVHLERSVATGGAKSKGRRGPLEIAHAIGQLPLPTVASGEGILSVNASPWGAVTIDGKAVGDSPVEARLVAGPHRVRIDVRGERGTERTVSVEAGLRTSFPALPGLR